MKFNPDFAVYVCPHVFDGSRPVLSAVRDHDGDWQFLCGEAHCIETTEPRLVGAGHLVARDPSLDGLTALEPGTYAERTGPETPWAFEALDDP